MHATRESKPSHVAIEDVVEALAAQCDGARRRDGRGFNRADAQEGGRLSALRRRDMAWSIADAKKAMEIVQRYPGQAAALLSGGSETKAAGIEKAIRAGRIPLRDEPVEKQQPYCYAGFSPGGRYVYFWKLAWVDDIGALMKTLRGLTRERHGVRRIYFQAPERADLTINGERKRAERLAIDFNGTTQATIVAAAKAHGYVLEPAIEEPVDLEIDRLRMNERAVWLHEGTRDGVRGTWAVFDLASKHEPFSNVVKTYLKGRYECRPDDDWNWYVEWNAETAELVTRVAKHFGFACADSFKAGFKEERRR
ncbi:hypothetical protein [Bosea sp. RAC05]|uniref:hypothetical protein n=1 Tax=Bosea sp. RAC05 TaxID=1842539 RepID=UPI00085615FD|nr:hypothetical protein [Bosea sp. RAC05]AOG03418.1 hypothetical protein BSY19_4934 [Bosea sp. RAC05]